MDEKAEKKSLQDRIDALKTTAKNVKMPNIKIPEIKKPNIKVPPVKDLFKKKTADEPKQEEGILRIESISTRNALKIIYFLMAADGQLLSAEAEKYDLIGQEITPYYAGLKEIIVGECQAQLDKVIDADDFYDVVQDGVEDALISSIKTEDTFITPKLLVWDLMTIAYSDGSYDEIERRLIKYVVRKLDIDKAVFLEMENAIQTMMDLEKELQWIKTTDRPYLTIEAMVNEIEDRKHVIFDSVKDLIAL